MKRELPPLSTDPFLSAPGQSFDIRDAVPGPCIPESEARIDLVDTEYIGGQTECTSVRSGEPRDQTAPKDPTDDIRTVSPSCIHHTATTVCNSCNFRPGTLASQDLVLLTQDNWSSS